MIKKLIRVLLFGLVLFLPLIYLSFLPEPAEFPKAIVFSLVVLLSIGLYIVGIITGEIRKIKFSNIHKLLILYITIGIIASGQGVDFRQSFWGQYYRYQGLFLQILLFLFSFLLAQQELEIKKELVVKLVAGAGVITAVLLLLQGAAFFLHFPFPTPTFNGRMTAFLGNPNFAAGFLALSFPYLAVLLSFPFLFLFSLVFFLALLLTQSRAALLSFLIFLPAIWGRKAPRKNLLWGAGVLLFVLVGGLLFPQRPFSSFENRLVIWQKGIAAWRQRPLLGWGVEHFESAFSATLAPTDFDLKNIRVDKAHNELLEVAVTEGVLGVVAWLAVVLATFRIFWQSKDVVEVQAAFFSFLIFLFLSLFNVLSIVQYLLFYLSLGLAAAEDVKMRG